MTPEQAIEQLKNLSESDPEEAHQEADSILLEVLKSNGLEGVANAFADAKSRIGFWY